MKKLTKKVLKSLRQNFDWDTENMTDEQIQFTRNVIVSTVDVLNKEKELIKVNVIEPKKYAYKEGGLCQSKPDPVVFDNKIEGDFKYYELIMLTADITKGDLVDMVHKFVDLLNECDYSLGRHKKVDNAIRIYDIQLGHDDCNEKYWYWGFRP